MQEQNAAMMYSSYAVMVMVMEVVVVVGLTHFCISARGNRWACA